MEIELTNRADKDLEYWQKTNNKKVLKRVRELIESIINTPYSGIGKPEGLKYNLSGKWSRRIDLENRIIYEIEENLITIHSLKGHY